MPEPPPPNLPEILASHALWLADLMSALDPSGQRAAYDPSGQRAAYDLSRQQATTQPPMGWLDQQSPRPAPPTALAPEVGEMVVAATWEAEELAGEEYERAAQPSPAAPPAPVGEGPTDDELLAMRSWSSHGHTFDSDLVDFARAVLTRWGHPATSPAPQGAAPWADGPAVQSRGPASVAADASPPKP